MAKLDKEKLFARIGYRPHEGQLRVHRSDAKRRVVACGVRWGKTTVAVHEALAAMLSPTAPSRGWVVSPSFATTNLIVEQVFDLLQSRFSHRIIELSERRRFAAVENLAGNRTEVQAKSAHRPAALLGESLDWVILDEAARMKAEVWNEHLSQRLVDRDGWALIASTPWQNGDWFHEEFQRGQDGEPGYASWTGPTVQNPRIGATVVEAEKERHSPEVFYREYGGEFVPASGVKGRPTKSTLGTPKQVHLGTPKLVQCLNFSGPGAAAATAGPVRLLRPRLAPATELLQSS